MRGLGTGTIEPSEALKAAITAVAVLAALGLFVSACATGGTGARDEGPASSDTVVAKAATPSASPTTQEPTRQDVVKLVKSDPEVAKAVKDALKPCVADEYPVDVSYGELTGGPVNDIVVNVMTCHDAVGVGAYVYRMENHRYENVFKAEEPPVYAEIDRGDLVVTQQSYEKGDPVTYPSIEQVITYNWRTTYFARVSSTQTQYSNAVGNDDTPAPARN
ncbi:hypothetical protein ACFOZ0_11485 [Streptomyces yaanensis]|uniref:Lipoprotein CseA n=1 Tax=Streptomyces yaanensis TaxID=1142239 RepID=A0ABV7SA94_9ACTN|nr:hypothetical protein [Streptomyces sp. CGMCC 4.7035]WNB96950.1 hypothetical protein Q2K21_02065 [Streptomyces sp. CGMCC 4.7035]